LIEFRKRIKKRMKERKKRERKKENDEQVVKDCDDDDNGIMCLPRMPKTMARVWTVSSFIEIIAMILFFVFLLRF
jgi:hypothetical protein